MDEIEALRTRFQRESNEELERRWKVEAELQRKKDELAGCSLRLAGLEHVLQETRESKARLLLEKAQKDIAVFVAVHEAWSIHTFGPSYPVDSIIAHIRKECEEFRAKPWDRSEAIDIILLGMDLWSRGGGKPDDFLQALWDKHKINLEREWATNEEGIAEQLRGE